MNSIRILFAVVMLFGAVNIASAAQRSTTKSSCMAAYSNSNVERSNFKTNRDLTLVVRELPMQFIKDINSLDADSTVLDTGSGISRVGSDLVFLRYDANKTFSSTISHTEIRLPKSWTVDAGKIVGFGGSIMSGMSYERIILPEMGTDFMTYKDKMGRDLFIPVAWVGPGKAKQMIEVLSKDRNERPNYIGITYNLIERPMSYYSERGEWREAKPLDWTDRVKVEQRFSKGKFDVRVGSFKKEIQSVDKVDLIIDKEGVLTYSEHDFSQNLQSYIDKLNVGGVLWWSSLQLAPKHPSATLVDGDPVIDWLRSIDGIEVKTFKSYPDVVRITKKIDRVRISKLLLQSNNSGTPPKRAFLTPSSKNSAESKWDRLSTEEKIDIMYDYTDTPIPQGLKIIEVEANYLHQIKNKVYRRYVKKIIEFLKDNGQIVGDADFVGAPEIAGVGPQLLISKRTGEILGAYIYIVQSTELNSYWISGYFGRNGEYLGQEKGMQSVDLIWSFY